MNPRVKDPTSPVVDGCMPRKPTTQKTAKPQEISKSELHMQMMMESLVKVSQDSYNEA
jgi:hypothetical protein